MEPWNRLTTAFVTARESLAVLEQIYSNVEEGVAGETDWRYWATQVLSLGRTILRIVVEIRYESESLADFSRSLEQLCSLVGCEGE